MLLLKGGGVDSKQLQALGMRPAQTRKHYNMLIGTEGIWRTGKTDFMLRKPLPGPIGFFNLDKGSEDVEEKMIAQYGRDDIYVSDIKIPAVSNDNELPAICADIWANQLYPQMLAMCTKKLVRTISVDTGDLVWEIVRYAKIGKLKGVPQNKYEESNYLMKSWLQMPQDNGLNLICSHALNQVWDDYEYKKTTGEVMTGRKWTGEYYRDGFKKTQYIFRVNIRHLSRPIISKSGLQTGVEFGFRVLDCTAQPHLAGKEYWGEEANFQVLAMDVYPNSELSDWE